VRRLPGRIGARREADRLRGEQGKARFGFEGSYRIPGFSTLPPLAQDAITLRRGLWDGLERTSLQIANELGIDLRVLREIERRAHSWMDTVSDAYAGA
jgi:hypothetical protein